MTRALFLALCVVALAGCKPKEPASAPGPAHAGSPAAGAEAVVSPGGPVPMPAPEQPIVVAAGPDANATLGQLSLELRKYVVRSRSSPKTFDEFIARSRVQAPPPPPGKKYAISSGAIILVNR